MYRTADARDTAAFGGALGALLKPGDTVLLTGNLGAGKSVLARGVARALGVKGAMPSPTFTLMQPYQGRVPVYHFDLYRLSDEDEFYASGLSDYLGGDGVALVEWPLSGLDASPSLALDLRYGANAEDRLIDVNAADMPDRAEALAAALAPWKEAEA